MTKNFVGVVAFVVDTWSHLFHSHASHASEWETRGTEHLITRKTEATPTTQWCGGIISSYCISETRILTPSGGRKAC